MSTHFSVDGSLKNDPVLLSFLLSAEIILHRCQLQRISFWVKRRKMCSAIAAVTSGFYSRCEKTSLCVYLSPGPRISQAGSFAASAPRPICCRSAQAAGRREARERSHKLTSAIVSYSHCAWWDWKCSRRLPEASLSSLRLWETVLLHCKLHPRLWPGTHFS